MKKIITSAFLVVAILMQSVAFASTASSSNISFAKLSFEPGAWSIPNNTITIDAANGRVSNDDYNPKSAVYNNEISKNDLVVTADVRVNDAREGNQLVLKMFGLGFAFRGDGVLNLTLGNSVLTSENYRENVETSQMAFQYLNRGCVRVFKKVDNEYKLVLEYENKTIANKSDGKFQIDFSYVSAFVGNMKIYEFDDVMHMPEYYMQYNTTQYTPYLTNLHLTSKENLENAVKGGEGYQLCYCSAISDTNPDIMVRGFDTSGVYYSHDGGVEWHVAEKSPDCILSIAFYPGSDKICFALVGGLPSVSGIYKSVDGGVNFERVYAIGQVYTILNCELAFGKANEKGIHPIYFAISGQHYTVTSGLGNKRQAGVFKSNDLGETFENIGFEDYLITNICADRESDTVAVVTGRHIGSDGKLVIDRENLYISRDAGATWGVSSNGLEGIPVYAVAINPANTNEWVCSNEPRDPDDANNTVKDKNYTYLPPMLFKSYDAGETWTKMNVSWQTEEQKAAGKSPSTHGLCMVAKLLYTYPDAEGKNALIADFNESVYQKRISFDGGENFECVTIDETNSHEKGSTGWYLEKASVTQADPDLILWGTYISHNKGHKFTWNNSGISGFIALDFDFDENGLRYVGGYDMGRMARVEGFDSIYPLMEYKDNINYHLLSTYIVAVDPKDPKHIFSTIGSSTYGGESCLIESFDALETYTFHVGLSKRMQEMTKETGSMKNITYAEFSPADPNVVYTNWFVSSDNGKTWRESSISISACSPFDADVAYGRKGDVLYITRDRAKTWENTGISLKSMNRILPDVNEEYVVWCSTHSDYEVNIWRVDFKTGIVKTFGEENGLRHKNAGEHKIQITELGQSYLDPNVLFAITRDYYDSFYPFFISYDCGETWIEVEGFPSACGNIALEADPYRPLVYLAGAQGLWVFDYQVYRDTVLNNNGGNN